MAFTTINSGDSVKDVLPTVVAELSTALQERQFVLGKTQTPVGGLPGQPISTSGNSAITTLRNGIDGLITGARKYLYPTFTAFPSTAALLTAAGYPGGWDTDYHVHNKGIWQQFQDVFGSLRYYMDAVGSFITASYSSYERSTTWHEYLEDAWDDARAAAPSGITTPITIGWRGRDFWIYGDSVDADATLWGPLGTIPLSLTSRYGNLLEFTVSMLKACVNPDATGPGTGLIIDFSCTGGNTWTLDAEDPESTTFPITVSTNYLCDGTAFPFQYSITETEPSGFPLNHSGVHGLGDRITYQVISQAVSVSNLKFDAFNYFTIG